MDCDEIEKELPNKLESDCGGFEANDDSSTAP